MSVNVNPEAIRSLAGSFRTAADALGQHTASFRSAAELRSNAFGSLPAGQQAFADYTERLLLSVSSLRQLQATLLQFASNLETTAANWEQADQGSTTESP